ncbi:alpha/beta hydrolase [Acidiferrimicrobium sp. IK]|uniref:alpha/beta fold hydrolase n=1 Tax=Acidiferrimicrobium sp. IK TaxID=2871700 RepID=UPI0021CB3269|nr:alpha/beta hydrolase [Acidiferrimicrobium sp. IK]MCU4183649.1 alpha/beta hydrolase [Acidiferrimicrobium sp. IK]
MPTPNHRVVTANGIRIHLVEEGAGPAVLLVHGFPESWYSWRHQLPALAAAGYRAIAIDVRGYGRSSTPAAVDAYRMTQHVGDNVAVLDALGVDTAVVVGHDWGSPIAANTALLRPDRFPAVALLSVPYAPRGDGLPTASFTSMGGDEEFYIMYFQQPGRAEAEIEPDIRSWLLGFYVAASGEAVRAPDGGTITTVRPGGQLKDRFVYPEVMPSWLSDADLDVYTAEFEYSGFAGALNRYRNVDRDWEDLSAWYRAPITQPSLFIGGELDGPTRWGQRAIDRYPQTLPGLRGSHVLAGCGHWVQQERPAEVNELLVGFLSSLA